MPGKEKKQVTIAQRLVFSGISGAVATTCIYPIDITKTKLQDDRAVGAARRFKGPLDCAKSIIRKEGFAGMYRGYPPNVILVMPEKALKLTMNHLFRQAFMDRSGATTCTAGEEMLAGGLAGFIQVAATNPMELLKIQGATMKDKFDAGKIPRMLSYRELVQKLGLTGCYTGVLSTWARDVPFSVVYFSCFSKTMEYFNSENEENAAVKSFAAGSIAGTLAAAVTTPIDVVKTRVHSNAKPCPKGTSIKDFWSREGRLIVEQTQSILKTEGSGAFFKGVVPRCFIISPLFAITMTVYSMLQDAFVPDDDE